MPELTPREYEDIIFDCRSIEWKTGFYANKLRRGQAGKSKLADHLHALGDAARQVRAWVQHLPLSQTSAR